MLDTRNTAAMDSIVRRIEADIRVAKYLWEKGNNSGDPEILAAYSARCETRRAEIERELSQLHISTDWPGLFPTFTTSDGRNEHNLRSAILHAADLRNDDGWLGR